MEAYNNRHFDVKLAPEFFDTKLIICIAFRDKPGEGSTPEIGFRIWLFDIDAPHDTEIKPRVRENAGSQSALKEESLYITLCVTTSHTSS
jgi:hypothetical protein